MPAKLYHVSHLYYFAVCLVDEQVGAGFDGWGIPEEINLYQKPFVSSILPLIREDNQAS